MRKNAFIAPILALAAGIAGFFLRRTELSTVFDEATGLAERGAAVTVQLAVLTAALLLLTIVFAAFAGLMYKSPRDFNRAFAPVGNAFMPAYCVLGAVWLLSAAIYVFNIRSAGAFPTVEIYFSALSAASALSVALFAVLSYKRPSGGARLFFSVIPALFMCFWLVLLYKQNASNPVLLSYCYQCLAISASALGFYFTSGYAFSKPSPGKAILCNLAAIYFCCVTLADSLSLEIKAVFAVIVIISIVNSVLLIRNLERKPRSEAPSAAGDGSTLA